MVHLPHPVDAIVLGVDAPELREKNRLFTIWGVVGV
jgi:hypothetical protein